MLNKKAKLWTSTQRSRSQWPHFSTAYMYQCKQKCNVFTLNSKVKVIVTSFWYVTLCIVLMHVTYQISWM